MRSDAVPAFAAAVVLPFDDAAHRHLRRSLRRLVAVPVAGEHRVLADGLLAGVIAALDAEDRRARRALRAARAAAVVGGLAATAGAVAIVRGRRFRPATWSLSQ